MDFRKLEAFCKVYELRSFSKAGLELHLSQPTISAHVASLEEQLGLLLFDRLGRNVLPTNAGNVLYREGREIFSVLRRAEAELSLLRDEVAGELVVGGSTIPANYILPQLLAKFMAIHPAVRIELRTGDTDEVTEMVAEGRLDLAVVGSRPEVRGVASEPVFMDRLTVVAASGYSTPKTCSLPEWPWIMREQGSGTRRAFEQSLAANGYEPSALRSVCLVYGTEAAMRVAGAGAGLAVVSARACEEAVRRQELCIVDCGLRNLDRKFYLLRHEGRRALPAAEAFLSFIREHADI
ncbi:MAG: selenium metabolism-associated LysR family transcriptional regulator [Desulfovibrio sp.]